MNSILSDLRIKPGAAPAKDRLEHYSAALHLRAQNQELAGRTDNKLVIAAELCSVLRNMVNSDAVLSDGQLQNLHVPLRNAADKFALDGFKSGEDVTDMGSLYLMEIAIYLNSCRG